jgi:hypothetical protein
MGGPTLGRWRFQSRLSADGRGDDLNAFRYRLAAALRAGHGVGGSFRLSTATGPDAPLWLTPEDAVTARWIARALSGTYDRHQWRWSSGSLPAPAGENTWMGRRSLAYPEPLRSIMDPIPAFDAVALTLGTLPPGASFDWSFRPLPLTYAGWWETDRPPTELPSRRVGTGAPFPAVHPAQREEVRDRPPFWEAHVRVCCTSTRVEPGFDRRVVRALESATRTVRGNGLRFQPHHWWAGTHGPAFLVAEAELVGILPSPGCPTSGGPETGGDPHTFVLPLGRTAGGKVVGPAIEPDQGRHLAILGETGMGKSSLLVALCQRTVGSSGLIFFDPLGETARAVRAELPSSASARVAWIEPGVELGLNALEGIGPASDHGTPRQERQLSDLVYSLRRVRSGRYADSGFWGPRLEEMLTRALRAAAALPEGTLVDAHSLLGTGGRGFRTLPPEASEPVRELADRIRSRPEDADGARRLLYEVTRSPVLVRMLCARAPEVRAQELVAPGKIVLISGDAARVGESTARYLLSVYLALLWSELLARPRGAKTFVVLDEAQWFVHESLAEMLRLGRRRNVHVVLATQAIASLPDIVSEAVWTNVADFVAFRGSPDEAREFSRVARGIPPESILSLPRGEAAVLLGKGYTVQWIRTARIPGMRSGDSGAPLPEPNVAPVSHSDPGEEVLPSVHPPSSPPKDGGGELSELLDAIRIQVSLAGTAGPVRIALTTLRRDVHPNSSAIRAAGALLGRSGAIVWTGRDEQGPCWWIDPSRIPGVASLARRDRTETGSEPSQHS